MQRRSYWLLDSDDTTVLVHYLEGQASRRLLTDENGATIAKPSQRKRKAQKTTPVPPPQEQAPAQLDAMQHVHMQQVQPPPASDTPVPPAPAATEVPQVPVRPRAVSSHSLELCRPFVVCSDADSSMRGAARGSGHL